MRARSRKGFDIADPAPAGIPSPPLVSATLVAIYCLGIVGASLLGGALPSLLRLTHRRLQLALSFVAGAMLGVALFHMLPHAVLESMHANEGAGGSFGHGDFDRITVAMVCGFLVMFLLERFARFHRHEPAAPGAVVVDPCTGEEAPGAANAARSGRGRKRGSGHAPAHGHVHGHGDEHGHAHHHGDHHGTPRVNAIQWGGALLGLSLHAILEGVALAASVMAGHAHDDQAIAGLGTFLVILLHKPFDSMTLITLVRASDPGAARRKAMLLNVGFALIVPLGAFLFMLGAAPLESTSMIVPLALAFSAGTFLCIASSDLLPELQFHQHDRAQLSISLVLGLVMAWSIGLIESEHHHHGPAPADAHDHNHDHDHDHAHDHEPAPSPPKVSP